MPKKSLERATWYGNEGLVVDANDKLHELDSARNLDGSVVDGFESDERTVEDRDGSEQALLRGLPDDPRPVEFDNSDLTGDLAKAAPSGQTADGELIPGSMSNTEEQEREAREQSDPEFVQPEPDEKPAPAKSTARKTGTTSTSAK